MALPQGSLGEAAVPNSDSRLHVDLSGLRLSVPVSHQTRIPIRNIPHTHTPPKKKVALSQR